MARIELSADENLRLLREIEANRAFILLAYQSNPELLSRADSEIRRHFENAAGIQPVGKRQSGDATAQATPEFDPGG